MKGPDADARRAAPRSGRAGSWRRIAGASPLTSADWPVPHCPSPRAGKVVRVADKFIPDADSAFAGMARRFWQAIARDPARYGLGPDAAAEICAAVSRFRDALAATHQPLERNRAATYEKDAARAEAERVVRRYANRIRADEAIDSAAKAAATVRVRPTRLRRRRCPAEAPDLAYLRTEMGEHVLQFAAAFGKTSKAKPAGAARLELFVEHVPPGRAIPRSPSELGGRAWYLRSYTASPMRVKFPVPPEPAMVVYWARWASATGEVGRFCPTVQARVEGWPAARAAA